MSIDFSNLDYPADAAAVRDLIRQMMRSQVDQDSSMDGGGGFAQADLWVWMGGVEYLVTVRATGAIKRAEKGAGE